MAHAEFLAEQAYLMRVMPLDGGVPDFERQRYLEIMSSPEPEQKKPAPPGAFSLADIFEHDSGAKTRSR